MHKKILFVTRPLAPPWDEGSKNFAYNLAKNLTDKNITILTKGTIEDAPKHLTQQPIYTSADLSFPRLLFFLWRHAKNYDIIHLLFTPTRLNALILRRLLPRKKKIIQTIATLRDDLYDENQLRTMFFGDVLVPYSRYAQKKLIKLFAQEQTKKIVQIYPGIDLEKYHPTGKDPELVKKYNIHLNHFIVAYPGEFARLGATDVIVSAFIELWSDPANAHIRYLCACRIKTNADALKKNEVIERFRRAGHLDKVIFTDTFLGDMNKIYNLADLILFPVVSMAGKFDVPLAMIEPYACKKIVVASDLPIFHEFSTNDINVIIPRNSSREITQAILTIANNSSAWVRRGERAYTFVHKTFNITKIAQQYKHLYDQL